MRIWHQELLPYLCRQHLLACWREALGAYKIITSGSKGYSRHPAVLEFVDCPEALHARLDAIREEGIKRGYNFRELPPLVNSGGEVREWETLTMQAEKLSQKGCDCRISEFLENSK